MLFRSHLHGAKIHPKIAIFFPRVILYYFFLFLLIYGGLGFGASGVGPSGFLGLGSLYKHKRISLGKKWCKNDKVANKVSKEITIRVIHEWVMKPMK